YIAAGWKLRGLRGSGSPRTWSEAWTGTATDIGGDGLTITLSADPDTNPAEGDLIVQEFYDGDDSQTDNTAQSASQHDYAFMCDTDFGLGTDPVDPPHLWG